MVRATTVKQMRAHTDELINKERFRVKTKLSVSFYWNSLLL